MFGFRLLGERLFCKGLGLLCLGLATAPRRLPLCILHALPTCRAV
ncbi:hypothetical protein HMPREF9123_1290 [Neisseria bacilliformis ATCC BAA-1200]|uniref:Uncharacterized protein n=1 Tax=Neisseria bacilliformis ATCC BAA-1200 TaxID=888742 RepID=F2BC35_9NEIS|nr:hypothetical protein HMPREF9123_1290 [Neisseria bacilliformis ATCC BAA-1200]